MKLLVYTNEVIWHEGNGVTIWEASFQCCIMRKVIREGMVTGGRFDFSGL